MNKYQNGKIYQITSKQTDDVYIGSTIQRLSSRLTDHKAKYKNVADVSSRELMKYDDVIIELIELYPCETREDLLWRERYWIENIKCVNLIIPIRVKEEMKEYYKTYKKKYYKENQEQQDKNAKLRYEKNKEHILQYKKKHYEENKEHYNTYGQEYYKKNKDKLVKQKKLIYENNKEKIKEKSRAYSKFRYSEFGKLCKMF